MRCYEIIEEIKAAIHSTHYPNVTAIAKLLVGSDNPDLVAQYSQYAYDCLKPGIEYFHQVITGPLQKCMAAFKAARLFSPSKIHEMQPSSNEVDSLRAFPFLDNNFIIDSLKEELPSYLSKASDVSPEHDPIAWWASHIQQLPKWSDAAQKIFLVQPSSAGAERAFSLLNNTFGDQQQNCLEDYVEASLMLQYNKR